MGTSVRMSRSVAVLAVALAMVFTSVSAALAADPSNDMQTIKSIRFDSASHGFVFEGKGTDPSAYWGVVTSQRKPPSGSKKSLWVAGTKPDGTASSFYPSYPDRTSGRARLSLPTLSEYYSSQFSFRYNSPSRGAADATSFELTYGKTGGPSPDQGKDDTLLDTTSWVTKTYDLDKAKWSRAPMTFVLSFVDGVEFGGAAGGKPYGPEVDTFVVKGFKYGTVASGNISKMPGDGTPVPTVSAFKDVYETTSSIRLGGVDNGTFGLQWSPPQRAVGDYTADDREIAYRVWRTTDLKKGPWEELTWPTDRLGAEQIQDYVPSADTYYYAIQPWDEGTGQGRGKFITKPFTLDAPEGGAGSIKRIEYSVDGIAKSPIDNKQFYDLKLPPKNGAYTVRFRVIDNDDNPSLWRTISFKVLAKTYFTGLSGNKVPSYNAASYVSGTLKSGYSGVAGHLVALQRLSNRTSGSWVTVTTKRTSSTGYVKFDIPASSGGYNYTKTVYRMAYSGAAQFAAAPPSASRTIQPKAYVGKPWKSVKTVKAKKTYTWYASIKPRHTAGTKPVKLQFQRYKSGKWKAYKTVSAKAYNYSSYSRVKVKYKLPYKGTWRVRAVHSDTGHATSYSSWYKFKVK